MPYAYLNYFETRTDDSQSYLFNPYTGETIMGYQSLEEVGRSARVYSIWYPPEYPVPQESLDLGHDNADLNSIRDLKVELGEDKAIEFAAVKLQAWYRGYKGRKAAKDEVRVSYTKSYDYNSGCFYYTSLGTGETQWHKPVGLGWSDLPCLDDLPQLEMDPSGVAEGKLEGKEALAEKMEDKKQEQPRKKTEVKSTLTIQQLRERYPWCAKWRTEEGGDDNSQYYLRGPFNRRAGRGKVVDSRVTDVFIQPPKHYDREPYRSLENTEYCELKLGEPITYIDKGSEKTTVADAVFLFRVAQSKGPAAVLELMDRYSSNVDLQVHGFNTISKMDYAEDEEGNISDPARWGANMCLERMETCSEVMKIQAFALSALCTLAANYAVRRYLSKEKENWLELLKSAVSKLRKINKSKTEIDPETDEFYIINYDEPSEDSLKVAEYACRLISVLGYDERLRLHLSENALDPVLYCMDFCDDEVMVQMNGCLAIYNLCYRNEEAQGNVTHNSQTARLIEKVIKNPLFQEDRELLRIANKALLAVGEEGYRGLVDDQAFDSMMTQIAQENADKPQLPRVHYDKKW